jgi:hypothetical protein
MLFDNIAFKSYCWCLGTTSFRTKNFNRTIELQLALLDQFWKLADNQDECWIENTELQERYYYFLQDNNFVYGDAPNPAKDAREKTSGLVDLGLITAGRKLTHAGGDLLKLSQSLDFSSDNILQIPADSFIYLKQLLKMSSDVNGNNVRPLIVLLRVLLDDALDGYITKDEFTYLLPLCVNHDETEDVVKNIISIRQGRKTIDEAILDALMHMDNYNAALNLLLNHSVSEELICVVGMNRKSRKYDKSYYWLYKTLFRYYIGNDLSKKAMTELYACLDKITLSTAWKKFLFKSSNKSQIINNPVANKRANLLSRCTNEQQFKEAFFKTMHLLKAKATLHDYYDLNKRYLSTADVLLFEDEKVYLDIVPKQFFAACIENLYEEAYVSNDNLACNCNLLDISDALLVSETEIIQAIEEEYHIDVDNMDEVKSIVEKQRYERLNSLIDQKFTDENLITILNLLDERDDDTLMSMVTDNADAPTIFEYILAILWYKISDRKGKVLDYMKLSLDTNLLPKSHAAGGEADIVFEYNASESYPKHTLLIEATLADKNNQRRMEMEPVSRHLGDHLLATGNLNSYCVFATNNLNPNVISDFRHRKDSIYYDPRNITQSIKGMKIIPLETGDLRTIIRNNKHYAELYQYFENAYRDENIQDPITWWLTCLRGKLNTIV